MKFAKLAVIGQLAIAAVLVGVFALKSPSAAGGAHAKPAEAGAAHPAPAHQPAGDKQADETDDGPGHDTKLAAAEPAGKAGKGPKPAKGAGHDTDGGHGASSLAGDPKQVARALLEGNARFLAGKTAHPDLEQQRETSAGGQHPGAMVLGCADSRVPPELVFDRGIGELFVVRSAGNIAEPVAVGSLEYAAEHLHAKVLLVLGHEKCGAVQAALSEQKMPSPNLEAMVAHIAPAVKGLKAWAEGDDLVRMAVEANVRRQAEEVLKRSPLLRQAVAKGEITILKAVYDIETGRVRPI